MERIDWQRLASMLFCLVGGGILLYFGLRFCLTLLLPFLIAFLASLLVRRPARKLSQLTKIPQGLCAVVLLLATAAGLLFLLFFAANRLFEELRCFLEGVVSGGFNRNGLLDSAAFFLEGLVKHLGLESFFGDPAAPDAIREWLRSRLADLADRTLTALTAELPRMAAWLLSAMPNVLFVGVVTVISGVYFCLDGDAIIAFLVSCLPQSVRARLPMWRMRMKGFSGSYLRAYLLLTLLTFSGLFLGFSILRIEYAFLLAGVVAVVDLLPILGVGTVLLPWAVILLIRRNFYLGFGLLILYAALVILRQILEPRLVGKSLGLHPLLMIVSSYVGLRVFGIVGMLLAPLFAILVKNFLAKWRAVP